MAGGSLGGALLVALPTRAGAYVVIPCISYVTLFAAMKLPLRNFDRRMDLLYGITSTPSPFNSSSCSTELVPGPRAVSRDRICYRADAGCRKLVYNRKAKPLPEGTLLGADETRS